MGHNLGNASRRVSGPAIVPGFPFLTWMRRLREHSFQPRSERYDNVEWRFAVHDLVLLIKFRPIRAIPLRPSTSDEAKMDRKL
jgi:hypothetical protein